MILGLGNFNEIFISSVKIPPITVELYIFKNRTYCFTFQGFPSWRNEGSALPAKILQWSPRKHNINISHLLRLFHVCSVKLYTICFSNRFSNTFIHKFCKVNIFCIVKCYMFFPDQTFKVVSKTTKTIFECAITQICAIEWTLNIISEVTVIKRCFH